MLGGDQTEIESGVLALNRGVTYRLTVQLGDEKVCVHDTPEQSSTPVALPGNPSGCASRGPLLIDTRHNLPQELHLHSSSGPILSIFLEGDASSIGGHSEQGTMVFTTAPSETVVLEQGSNTGLVVGAVLGGAVLFLVLGIGMYFFVARGRKQQGLLKSTPTQGTDS